MKKIVSVIIIAGLVGVMGCMGKFQLTSKLNDGIVGIAKGQTGGKGSQWAAEGVFLICAILPVYAIAILGDALIFNSIEFWSGDNPIALSPKFIKKGEKQAVVKYNQNEKLLNVFLFDNYKPSGQFQIKAIAGKPTLVDADGNAFQAKSLGNGNFELASL